MAKKPKTEWAVVVAEARKALETACARTVDAELAVKALETAYARAVNAELAVAEALDGVADAIDKITAEL